ncbi:hypothetical protein CHS0354_019235 [Potamilus streckersoni]|uniref:Uncharacterized protein n=1 Tax=Potamilus streckersoni TaxID=2493646 RepID=A0AAE0W477_9BIVA|nr:hypothetical protein CHS0354_019235 [Potamilus streckersoni]
MAVEVSAEHDISKIDNDFYRVRRTEAYPKHSLFGTSLEKQEEEQWKDLDIQYYKQSPQPRRRGDRCYLPEEFKAALPETKFLEQSKRQFEQQKEAAKEIENILKSKEKEALLFNKRFVTQNNYSSGASDGRPYQKFTLDDIAHSKEINQVGLNERQSYNRDKYGNKPPVHNYSLIGDLLRPGMDFMRRERTDIQNRNLGFGPGDIRNATQTTLLPKRVRDVQRVSQSAHAPTSGEKLVDLPPNIRHKYGSKVVDSLLSDKNRVVQSLNLQQERKVTQGVHRNLSKEAELQKFSSELNKDYEMLSNSMRQNIFAGYTTDHKISTTKKAFNDQVHLFRHPNPDKYRYRRDELSNWAEHNVIRERMKKSWEAYFLETLSKKQPKT